MKIGKIMLVSILLLAILTVGAVSATEDILAAEDDAGDIVDAPADDIDLISDEEDENPDDDLDDGLDDSDEDEPKGTEDVEITCEFPSEIIAGKEYEINVTFDKEVTGWVYAGCDSNEYCNYVEGNSVILGFKSMDFGGQIYEIRYTGDENYAPKTINGEFSVSEYVITCDLGNNIYGEVSEGYIYAPRSFSDNITLVVNGKKEYQVPKVDGDYYYKIEDFDYGENTVRLIYHDETYGDFEDTFNVTTYPSIVLSNSGLNVHLSLPKDASGTLNVYDGYNEDKKLIDSVSMKDGYTYVSLYGLQLGEHQIYAEYVGDDKYAIDSFVEYINIEPLFTIPNVVFSNHGSFILIDVPSGDNGIMIFSESQWDDELEDNVIFRYNASVINGKGKLSLDELESGIHTLSARFVDENGESIYLYDGEFSVDIIDIDSWDILDGLYDGDSIIDTSGEFNVYLPGDLTGKIEIYVDGKLVKEETESHYNVPFSAGNLAEGDHKITIKYSGDEGNFTRTITLKSISCQITIPDESNQFYNEFTVELASNTTGTLNVYVDGKLYLTEEMDDTYYTFGIHDIVLGTHKVKITFIDDKTKKTTSSEKTVDFVYSLSIITNDEYVYGEENTVRVMVPSDVSGELTVKINGKNRKWAADGSEIIVDISDLAIGDYEITVSHSGDKKYYKLEETSSFSVIGSIIMPDYANNPITLTLPSNAKGNLIVNIYKIIGEDEDNEPITELVKTQTVKLIKGKAVYEISDLEMGQYSIEASYDGEDYYVSPREETIRSDINVEYDDDFSLNKPSVLNISVPLKEGTLKLTIGTVTHDEEWNDVINPIETKNFTLTGEKIQYVFTPKKIGEYCVTYELEGAEDASSFYFTITPKIEVPDGITYKNKTKITMELPEDATGQITVKVFISKDSVDEYGEEVSEYIYANKTLTSEFANGIASVDLPDDLSIGTYLFELNYTGNYGNYQDSYSIGVIPSVTLPDKFTAGEKATLEFELEGAQGDIEVRVPGEVIKVPLKDGKASVDLSGLPAGRYNEVIIRYTDSEGVNRSLYKEVYVKKAADVNVDVSAATVTTDLIVKVTLSDRLAPGNVTVKVNGVTKTSNIESGVATFNFGKLAYGKYPVEATFNGNNYLDSASKSATANVTYDPVIKASDYKAFYNEGKYSVTVYGFDKKLASGVKVVIKINGKTFKTVTTNKKGVATVKLTQVPKTYKISATSLGKTVTKKLTVKQVLTIKTVKVKKSAKKLVLTATLKSKKAIKGKTITFKFNGKTFKAKTNKKGVAKVTVKKSVLKKLKVGKKITYQATYLKDTVKKTAKVKK